MKYKYKSSGQITVFSAVVLLSVMMLAGVLVDISRITAGRAMVKRAANTAARSLLADYSSRLKYGYGLFAILPAEEEERKSRFEEYLSASLSIPTDEECFKGSMDLFGFRIEKINVTPIFNLSENKVIKQQILEYMKYRAPAELVEGFIERLSAVKEVGKMAEAYKGKVKIDKIIGSMDKSQQRLKKSMDGFDNRMDKFINGFNFAGSWENAYESFHSLAADMASVKSKIESINTSIDEMNHKLSKLEAAAAIDGEEIENVLNDLRAERSALQQAYAGNNSSLIQLWDEIRNSMTGDYIHANNHAAKEIEKIAEKGKLAKLAIAELENFLSKSFGSEDGGFSKGFKEQTQAELDDLKPLILDGQRAEEMLRSVSGNVSILKNIVEKLDDAVINTGFNVAAAGGLSAELLELVNSYSNITYSYLKPDKGDKTEDPRDGKADAAKDFIMEKILEDIHYKTEGIDDLDLPSVTKVLTGSFDREDAYYVEEQQTNVSNGKDIASSVTYQGNLQNIENEIDLYDEEGAFQENALEFISDIGKLVAGEASELRDNIYINEYIMGVFKNSVSVIKSMDETIKDTSFHNTDLNNTSYNTEKVYPQTFYDSEVEYILHGNPSQKINNMMTKSELLLMRFGLNTLHVYSDGKKKAMASGIATAVAGWWTGGAGIPIITNLIMCGWGMGEAVIDLKDLMEGKSVPIYKRKGDWRLDIGLPVASEPETDKRLYFNYQDYLRLFLLTMNGNKKLDRLEDLIQLNIGKVKSGFKMSGCNTYVRVEAEVSMKYLFITQPFIRKTIKTNDGRHILKVLVYEGY